MSECNHRWLVSTDPSSLGPKTVRFCGLCGQTDLGATPKPTRTVKVRIAVAALVVHGEVEELEAVWESETAMNAAREIMNAGSGKWPNSEVWVTVALPVPEPVEVEGVVEDHTADSET